MKQERKTERQKMKKQNKRLVAQPKGEGKCHSLTPNANLATVAPRARVGDASGTAIPPGESSWLHLAHAWEMRPLPPRREKNILLHLAHAWEMRQMLNANLKF